MIPNTYTVGVDPSLEVIYANMTPPLKISQWQIINPSRLVATDGLLMLATDGKDNRDDYRFVRKLSI